MAYRVVWVGAGLIKETGPRVYMTEDGYYVDTGSIPPVAIHTPSPAINTADSNTGTNFRVFVQLGAASNGQIRVRFKASNAIPGDGLVIVGASIGKWDGNTLSSVGADMTTPPFRLKFSGANGATVPYNSTLTTDLVTHTGLTLNAGDWLIVSYYTGNPARQVYSAGHTDATTVFRTVATDFSQAQTGVDMGGSLSIVGNVQPGGSNGYNFSVDLVETNYVAPAGTGKPWKVWNGTSWVTKPVKVWDGASWVTKPTKVWNGSAWV